MTLLVSGSQHLTLIRSRFSNFYRRFRTVPHSSLGTARAPSSRAASMRAALNSSSAADDSCAPVETIGSVEGFASRKPPPAEARRSVVDSRSEFDVFIVGGGITGSALLFELAKFTNLKRIGLAERRSDFATVASGANNNSQTIHCGDIETNYSLQKAKSVKRHADMLRNYATKLPELARDSCIFKMQKLVLGVGSEECQFLEDRIKSFKDVFPSMELVSKSKLREIEPNIIRISNQRDRKGDVNALVIQNEYSAVNYYNLTHALIQQAQEITDKTIEARTALDVQDILLNEDGTYTIHTSAGTVTSRFVVVSACGYSLLFAQRLGYGLSYGCLPVAGSFYFAKAPILVGKVYTVQNPKLPFAAIHGDPDIFAKGFTRFGPTALPLPVLERNNWGSTLDFLKCSNLDLKLVTTLLRMFREPALIKYMLRNFLFLTPYYGLNLFLQDAKKVVPGLSRDDLVYASGFGGVRPQLVDKKLMKLIFGEGKIHGRNIIFNITPSPGGTTCLGTAEEDMRTICNTLGAEIYEDSWNKYMLSGEYPVVP